MRHSRTAHHLRQAPSVDDRVFRMIVESAIDYGILTVDRQGTITSWNAGAEELFGWRTEETVGKPLGLIYTPEDRGEDRVALELRTASDRGRASDTRWHVRKDGSRFWASGLCMPLKNEDDEVVGYVKIVRDQTERRRLADAVEAGERQLRMIIDSLPTLIGYMDRDMRYVLVNRAYERWFGLRIEEIVGKTARELVGPDTFELVRRHLESALAGHRVTFEATLPYATGTRWVRSDYVPHLDAKGRVIGVVLFIADIGEYKRLEAELQRLNAELDRKVRERTSELEELGELVESSHDAIFVRDLDGRIVFWNKGAEETYGYGKTDALGKIPHVLLRTRFPESLDAILDRVNRTGRWEGELEHTTRSGERLVLTSRWLLQRDHRGAPRAILEINRDITGLRRALEGLARANRELEELTYVSAHDLQEPLRRIVNYSELLSRRYKGKLDDEADGFLRFLTDSAARMKRVVSGVVAYTRVGREEGATAEVDLDEVLDRVLKELAPELEAAGAVVHRDALPRVRGKRHQLETLFRQLLLNAVAFKSSSPLSVDIESGCSEHDECVISVRDNGVGVTPENLGKIFEPLRTLRHEKTGAGIGLAICRRIVEHHGGRIWAESGPGRGVVIKFSLPKDGRAP